MSVKNGRVFTYRIETLDIGRHSNAYRGERALVCAIIEDVLEEIQYERVG